MLKKFASRFKQQLTQPRQATSRTGKAGGKNETESRSPLSYQKIGRGLANLSHSIAKIPQYFTPHWRKLTVLSRHPKFWLFVGLGAGVGGSAIAASWGLYRLESRANQSVEDVLTYSPAETITIQSADGIALQEIGPVSHEKLKSWQIPKVVKQAFIASEDRRFQDHGGVDWQGILRAAFSNLQAGEVVEGGSTITQQLARIVFLNQERTFGRKYTEMRLAQKIEQNLDKSQILERYLNLVYLGAGAYGVADAAWVYFSKPAKDLTAAEAATLASIVPAPSRYSPLEDPNSQATKERRDAVLQDMAEQGFLTPQQASAAIASPLTLNPSLPKRLQRQAPYFTDYILKELPKYIPPQAIKAGGITVETTLNAQWQQGAEKAVDKAIRTYGRWQGFQQAALVAIDPRSGQIKAMVGGDDFEKNQFNRVTQAKRQPGSTFKTFIYTTAIAAGFSPYRSFRDAEYIVDGYRPENYGDKYRGTEVSLYDALASSLNVVAVQLLVQVGWKPAIEVAHKMGIESELQSTYSLALGASEVNLLELTSAYGTLANHGFHEPPYAISRILDRRGKVLYQAKLNPKPEAAIDEDTAAIMTWMLGGVVTSGTGGAAQIGRPVAGKTGTSDKARDLWFVGYIPQLVTGVWLGNDNNRPTGGASSTAAVVWRQFMLAAVEGMPIESFPRRPKLEGRQKTVKAEPIKPKRTYYIQPKLENQETATKNFEQEGERESRKSRRRRSRRVRSQTEPTKANVQSEPVKVRRSRRQAAPAPSPQSAAAPPPEAASPPGAAPLAPPAPRKGE